MTAPNRNEPRAPLVAASHAATPTCDQQEPSSLSSLSATPGKRDKAFAIRGVLFNGLGRCCDVAVTFFMTPFLVHTLGNEQYGIWAILMSLVSYYGLFDLGMRNAGIKYLAEYEATGDHRAMNRLVVTSLCGYAVLALAVLVTATGMAWFVPELIKLPTSTRGTIFWVVLLNGANVSLTLAGQIFSITLAAKNRFDLINVLGMVSSVLTAVLMVAVVGSGGGLIGMAAVIFVVGVITQLLQATFALKLLGRRVLARFEFDRSMLATILRFSLLDMFVTASKNLTTSAGAVIVGCVLGPAAVTVYALANNISHRLRKMAKEVVSVAMPIASKLHAQARHDDLRRLLILSTKALAAMAAIATIVALVFGKGLIGLWIGPSYVDSVYPIFCILMIARAMGMSSSGLHNMLVGMGQLGWLSYLAIIEGYLIVTGGVCLVIGFGLEGMAWSVLVTQLIVAGIGLPMCASLKVGLSTHGLFRRVAVPTARVAAITLVAAVGVAYLWPAQSLFVLILEMGGVGALGFGSIFYFCFDAATRSDIISAVVPKRLRTWFRETRQAVAPIGVRLVGGRIAK